MKMANITIDGPTKTVTGGQYSNPLLKFGKTARIESAFVGSEKEWALTDCDRTYSSDHCPVMAEVNLVH